jgi:hypothetical protein
MFRLFSCLGKVRHLTAKRGRDAILAPELVRDYQEIPPKSAKGLVPVMLSVDDCPVSAHKGLGYIISTAPQSPFSLTASIPGRPNSLHASVSLALPFRLGYKFLSLGCPLQLA